MTLLKLKRSFDVSENYRIILHYNERQVKDTNPFDVKHVRLYSHVRKLRPAHGKPPPDLIQLTYIDTSALLQPRGGMWIACLKPFNPACCHSLSHDRARPWPGACPLPPRRGQQVPSDTGRARAGWPWWRGPATAAAAADTDRPLPGVYQ